MVNCIDANHFDPDGTLTREQAATILSRIAAAAGKPPTTGKPSFPDMVSISTRAADSFQSAVRHFVQACRAQQIRQNGRA